MTCNRYAITLGLALVCPGLLPATGQLSEAAPPEEPMSTNPLIERAIADLAQRESVPETSIEVVSFEAVTWPDTSMGLSLIHI